MIMTDLDFKGFKDGTWYTDITAIDVSSKSTIVSQEYGIVEGVDIVQWTGVLDQNKKKIYSYDILKYDGILYTVKFKLGTFRMEHPVREHQYLSILLYGRKSKIVSSVSQSNYDHERSRVKVG